MTDRELMQQALDALEEYCEQGVLLRPIERREALRARLAQPEPEPVACIVKNCQNHRCEGKFVGDLCSPCHTFIMTGEGIYSQAYRNTQREWQGLTTDELQEIAEFHFHGGLSGREFYDDIEAKLKENNT